MKQKKIISLVSSLAVVSGCFFYAPFPLRAAAEAVTEGSGDVVSEMEITLPEREQTEKAAEAQSETPAPQSEVLTETRQTEMLTDLADTDGKQNGAESLSEAERYSETAGSVEQTTENNRAVPSEKSSEPVTERVTEKTVERKEEQETTEQQAGETDPSERQTEALTESLAEDDWISRIVVTPGESTFESETTGTETVSEKETELLEEIDDTSETASGSTYDTWRSYYQSGTFWDPSWYVFGDFRFSQVDKVYAIAEGGRSCRIYEEPDTSAKIIGEISNFDLAYVLDEDGDWSYIESGTVRGFVQSDRLNTGETAEEFVRLIGENTFSTATADVPVYENEAFTYTLTTVQEVLAPKQYAVAVASGSILEFASETARPVGSVSSGTCVCILERAENGWLYVESGDVRGFMKADSLMTGDFAESIVSDQGEDTARQASSLVDPKENRSLYYTLKSTKSAASDLSANIAETAAGFAGALRYIYGGTSLTDGADCSGFTQSVFASFGISIPRTAEEQGASGQAVLDLSEARAGDIIYYASGPHVGIYLGNGLVVQCAGNEGNTVEHPGSGVMICSVDYMPVTSIRRYVIEAEKMPESGTGIGRIDTRQYTEEQLELIWAIVAQEDNGSYDGALAVISSAMNRTESSSWGGLGSDALSQLTASGQYCYSLDNYWEGRLNGNVPSYVKQAVYDCLYRGVRNHTYTCFRSRNTGSASKIGGNWYFGS